MKKILSVTLASLLILSLTACKKADSSSATSSSDSASQSTSMSDASQSGAGSGDSMSQSTSASSSTESADPSSWPTSFVNLKDANGDIVLVEVKAPVEWVFDGTSTFSINDVKVMEVAGLEAVTSTTDPFEAAYKDQYVKTPEGVPEGFGYISTDKIKLESCNAVLHMWKMWPDDSDKPWYPHCYFVEKGEYLVSVNFYTFEENCTEMHKTYDAILNSLSTFK